MTGRFQTVTIDLDGTLLPHDTAFAAVLRDNGFAAEVAASDARFFAGEQTLEAAFWEQWAWVQTLTPADLSRALRKAAWLPGIDAGVAALRAAGLDVRVLTDQPDVLADFPARWGFGPSISSPTTVTDGRIVDVVARFDKAANLRAAVAGPVERVCHVGNGANDVPVWAAGATGVAVFADDAVARAADRDLGSPDEFETIAEAVLALHAG